MKFARRRQLGFGAAVATIWADGRQNLRIRLHKAFHKAFIRLPEALTISGESLKLEPTHYPANEDAEPAP